MYNFIIIPNFIIEEILLLLISQQASPQPTCPRACFQDAYPGGLPGGRLCHNKHTPTGAPNVFCGIPVRKKCP